jgi:hypothetical protein
MGRGDEEAAGRAEAADTCVARAAGDPRDDRGVLGQPEPDSGDREVPEIGLEKFRKFRPIFVNVYARGIHDQ